MQCAVCSSRAVCKVCAGVRTETEGRREGAVRDWLWSEVESWVDWVFTSVGKVGGSLLCRSHLPPLPDPPTQSRGDYLLSVKRGGGGESAGEEVIVWTMRMGGDVSEVTPCRSYSPSSHIPDVCTFPPGRRAICRGCRQQRRRRRKRRCLRPADLPGRPAHLASLQLRRWTS